MHITNKNFIISVIFFILFSILSLAIFLILGYGLNIMLAWNIFLAFIPVCLIYLIDNSYIKKKYLIIISAILWLLFYPNSIYVITDLIYLDSNEFMISYDTYIPYMYLENFEAYLMFFHIITGVIIAVFYGMQSLSSVYRYIKDSKYTKLRHYFIIALALLTSLAIYIGRFLRYNSWEMYKVISIIKELISSFSGFMVFFILMFTTIQLLIFYLVAIKRDIPKEEKDV